MSYLLSVCITSYKRIKELERCIKSIDSKYLDKVEIVVSEDCSPQKNEIKSLVELLSKDSPYKIIFNSNKNNVGYDKNLKVLQNLASGEYIFYLSDDDTLFPGALDRLIEHIEETNHQDELIFSPFLYGPFNEIKRQYRKSFKIEKGSNSAAKYVYDSILFSGLVFKKNAVINIEADRFENINYFQVYMFLHVLNQSGGYYLNELMINSISDGENAYGQVDSSQKGDINQRNAYLADRNSIFSNLEFNKGLFEAIKLFDTDNSTNIFDKFSKEYSLRTFGGMSRARRLGLKTFKDYYKKMNELDITYTGIVNIYYFILLVFGSKVGEKIFEVPKTLLIKIRKSK